MFIHEIDNTEEIVEENLEPSQAFKWQSFDVSGGAEAVLNRSCAIVSSLGGIAGDFRPMLFAAQLADVSSRIWTRSCDIAKQVFRMRGN